MITYQKIYNKFEQDFMACTTTGVLVQSIVGAIAAMYVLMHGTEPQYMVELFLVIACCMAYNGAVLSQQKPKITFNLLMVSLVVNTIIAAINVVL
ncbi:MAG: hypothetical protein EOO51_04425 [Flavobacterium sp.]|nr:MAG: hypothetical protein EOO51_04425 [Flavobacterium sp.]